MKKHYQFIAKPTSLLQDAQDEALRAGLEELYIIQEVHQERWLLGGTTSQSLPEIFEHLELHSEQEEVDWEHQSALFSPYYCNGKILVPLQDFSSTEAMIELLPGAGFGDLSHPTTRLVLRYMEAFVKDAYVLDIGCGNGILSFAAAHLGASYVNGIDIDENALIHAEQNKMLNHIENVEFSMEPSAKLLQNTPWIALMNMTFLEQKMAWNALSPWHKKISKIIVSGILTEQIEQYLDWAQENRWALLSHLAEENWSSFVFENTQE